MPMMGGGMIGPTSGAKVLQLSDAAGTDKLIIKDSDGFTVASIDSKGNLRMKGSVMRV